jgi:hypothetical protein
VSAAWERALRVPQLVPAVAQVLTEGSRSRWLRGHGHAETLGVTRMASVTVIWGWSVQPARDRAVLDLCFFFVNFFMQFQVGAATLRVVSVAFLAWFKCCHGPSVHG